MAASQSAQLKEWKRYLTRERNYEHEAAAHDVSPSGAAAGRKRRRMDSTFLLVLAIYTMFSILIGATVERMRGRGSGVDAPRHVGGRKPLLTLNDARRLTHEEDTPDTSTPTALESQRDLRIHANMREESSEDNLDPAENSNDDRAIFLISMGEKAEDIALIQRCLISIRRKGNWRGYVIVLTNVKFRQMYQDKLGKIDSYLFGDDSHIIALHPTLEHLKDTLANAKRDSMKIKRFKTRVLDVLNQDSRLNNVKMLIYLDIDIVVGRDINKFLNHARTEYNFGRAGSNQNTAEDESASKIYLFEDMNMPLHGGITLVERGSSEYCLEKWREEQDKNPKQAYDQVALLHMWEQNQKGKDTRCKVVQMKREKKHLVFPSEGSMKGMLRKDKYPTFVHVTNNHRAGKIEPNVQNDFFARVLELSEVERKGISSLLGTMIKGSA